METMMEDRWLSVDEIAAYVGIKRDTVYKWMPTSECPLTRSAAFGSSAKKKLMSG